MSDVRRPSEIYTVLEDGPEITDQLHELPSRAPTGGKQVHDASIVATMLVHGLTRLLTFNVDDFRRFAMLIENVTP